MDFLFNKIILKETKDLINKIKDNREYCSFVKELEYFINIKDEKFTDDILNQLQILIDRIKKLLELDEKIKEKEEINNLYEEIARYFKEQEIREEDLGKIKNGEIFKIIEELDLISGKEYKDLDLIFITRKGANEYKQEHKNEYEGKLIIKVIDNKDKLLEKILRIIENNY